MNNNTHKSKKLLERALKVTPVGAQTYSKSYRYFSGNNAPYFLERGMGGAVWDVDGNEYLDFILSLGAITIGYHNEEINEAIKKQLDLDMLSMVFSKNMASMQTG